MRAIDNCSKNRPKRTAWYNFGFPYLEGELVQEFSLRKMELQITGTAKDDRFAGRSMASLVFYFFF